MAEETSWAEACSAAIALCREPQPTVAWCESMDAVVTRDFTLRALAVDALAEQVRTRFLRRDWDFAAADHAINMLAGYAQRYDVSAPDYWQVYLDFDHAEIAPVEERLLRAALARPGDRVVRNSESWVPSEFDAWGRGAGIGEVVAPPMALADLGLVDVRWPAGRCTEDAAGLRWL